jgi:group I intron endonuclease
VKTISGIYQIQSKIKPDRIYIGSAVNVYSRWSSHLGTLKKNKHRNQKLQRHYNKYGESDLQFSILLGCDKEDLIKTEQYFIDSYNPFFNICKTAGSNLGHFHSEESKLKMSLHMIGNKHALGNKVNLGRKQSPETIAKRIAKTRGLKRSEEFKKRSSERNKGQISVNHFPKGYKTGLPAWNRGKSPSVETRKKQSEATTKYWKLKKELIYNANNFLN